MSNSEHPRRSRQSRAALHHAWSMERAAARAARTTGDTALEWHHLERSHILSQPMAAAHVRTHLSMLRFGSRARDPREVIGQVIRVIVAGPGSLSGRYPVGNTGGAAISARAVLPIPDDLRDLLRSAP